MVSIGISEFTYGFAFLFEQVNANWIGVDAAPILPSLQTEQMSGWDVSIPSLWSPVLLSVQNPGVLRALRTPPTSQMARTLVLITASTCTDETTTINIAV